jgi:hypothetical protein
MRFSQRPAKGVTPVRPATASRALLPDATAKVPVMADATTKAEPARAGGTAGARADATAVIAVRKVGAEAHGGTTAFKLPAPKPFVTHSKNFLQAGWIPKAGLLLRSVFASA